VVRVPGHISRGSGFDSPALPNLLRSSGSERGPLSLVSTTEKLLGRNSSGSGLENREYGRGDPLRWPRDTLYPQKLALSSSICGGRSVGIVRLQTKATEFVLLFVDAKKVWDTYLPSFHLWEVLRSINAYVTLSNIRLSECDIVMWLWGGKQKPVLALLKLTDVHCSQKLILFNTTSKLHAFGLKYKFHNNEAHISSYT
jgi:hypothetical protein